ncbi:hypothetical protein V6N13_063249 [Hibiscus sabdariffa]|uniref:Uncharacterized protein n=1 Tax=Hibiscus sabdariffa TaxID=183260 RepID=A0ABR2C4L4_9ROSI
MHFSWKKSKVARVSRLVAGLHLSPKRGASLVVETGFPTSVVDLFAKNRDRLRKSSKKKFSSSCGPQLLTTTPAHPQSPPSPPAPDMDVGEIVFITRLHNGDERIPFHAALKVSLAVALVVSTRSLAIWIMMAALLLVLFEFVWARFLGFFYPGIPMGLKSRTDELAVKQHGTELPDPREFVELEDEPKMETLACKSGRSRSARIKTSLIKKFVPKKLRHGKRKKQGKSKEPSSQSEKETLEREPGVGEEDESENEQGDMVSTSGRVLQVESDMEDVRKGNSGYVVLLVILAGLVGGRGVALFLTLICYLILIYTRTKMTVI